jgi:hypothetical protein
MRGGGHFGHSAAALLAGKGATGVIAVFEIVSGLEFKDAAAN